MILFTVPFGQCHKFQTSTTFFLVILVVALAWDKNTAKSELLNNTTFDNAAPQFDENNLSLNQFEDGKEYVIVSTHSGKVRGFRSPPSSFSIYFNDPTSRTIALAVDNFLGIPYAKPPVGVLRFRSPLPSEPWSIFDATKPPNACPQLKDTTFGRDFKGTDQWNAKTVISEDCLTLNIWVPYPRTGVEGQGSKPLAVLVWIYGGSYANGATSLLLYDGRVLASRYGVIVASINYRMGSMGFLYLGPGSEVTGNAGLFDQLLAMKWIKRNIGRFGGDPERITLVGESAGAASISYHLLSPISAPYFKNVILQSSAATNPWGLVKRGEALRRAKHLARAMQCEIIDGQVYNKSRSRATTPPPFYYRYHDYSVRQESDDLTHLPKHQIKQILACLRSQSIWNILWEEATTVSKAMDFPFAPVVDGELLRAHPKHLLDMGLFKRADVLLGTNANEGPAFLVYYLDKVFHPLRENVSMSREQVMWSVDRLFHAFNKISRKAVLFRYTGWVSATTGPTFTGSNPDDDNGKNLRAVDRMSSDYWFTCSVTELADYYAHIGERVYMYQLSHRSSQHAWPRWMGVMHGDEIAFEFGDPLRLGSNYTYAEKILSTTMMRFWTNFVKHSNPNINAEYEWTPIHWPIYTHYGKECLELNANMTKYNYNVTRGPRNNECAFQKIYLPQLQKETGTVTWIEILLSESSCQANEPTSGSKTYSENALCGRRHLIVIMTLTVGKLLVKSIL